MDTPVPIFHVIPEVNQEEKIDSIRASKIIQNYNTRSRVSYVTRFKKTPQMCKKEMTDTSTTQIGSTYIAHTYPRKDTIKWNQ